MPLVSSGRRTSTNGRPNSTGHQNKLPGLFERPRQKLNSTVVSMNQQFDLAKSTGGKSLKALVWTSQFAIPDEVGPKVAGAHGDRNGDQSALLLVRDASDSSKPLVRIPPASPGLAAHLRESVVVGQPLASPSSTTMPAETAGVDHATASTASVTSSQTTPTKQQSSDMTSTSANRKQEDTRVAKPTEAVDQAVDADQAMAAEPSRATLDSSDQPTVPSVTPPTDTQVEVAGQAQLESQSESMNPDEAAAKAGPDVPQSTASAKSATTLQRPKTAQPPKRGHSAYRFDRRKPKSAGARVSNPECTSPSKLVAVHQPIRTSAARESGRCYSAPSSRPPQKIANLLLNHQLNVDSKLLVRSSPPVSTVPMPTAPVPTPALLSAGRDDDLSSSFIIPSAHKTNAGTIAPAPASIEIVQISGSPETNYRLPLSVASVSITEDPHLRSQSPVGRCGLTLFAQSCGWEGSMPEQFNASFEALDLDEENDLEELRNLESIIHNPTDQYLGIRRVRPLSRPTSRYTGSRPPSSRTPRSFIAVHDIVLDSRFDISDSPDRIAEMERETDELRRLQPEADVFGAQTDLEDTSSEDTQNDDGSGDDGDGGDYNGSKHDTDDEAGSPKSTTASKRKKQRPKKRRRRSKHRKHRMHSASSDQPDYQDEATAEPEFNPDLSAPLITIEDTHSVSSMSLEMSQSLDDLDLSPAADVSLSTHNLLFDCSVSSVFRGFRDTLGETGMNPKSRATSAANLGGINMSRPISSANLLARSHMQVSGFGGSLVGFLSEAQSISVVVENKVAIPPWINIAMTCIARIEILMCKLQRWIKFVLARRRFLFFRDCVVHMQRLVRARRVRQRYLKVVSTKKSGRSIVLAVKQIDKFDQAATILGNGEYVAAWKLQSPPARGDSDQQLELYSSMTESMFRLEQRAHSNRVTRRLRMSVKQTRKVNTYLEDKTGPCFVMDGDRKAMWERFFLGSERLKHKYPNRMQEIQSQPFESMVIDWTPERSPSQHTANDSGTQTPKGETGSTAAKSAKSSMGSLTSIGLGERIRSLAGSKLMSKENLRSRQALSTSVAAALDGESPHILSRRPTKVQKINAAIERLQERLAPEHIVDLLEKHVETSEDRAELEKNVASLMGSMDSTIMIKSKSINRLRYQQ
ncbi:uncharacterized protein BJ171DRAFT_203882 [Polychytrium aggregatum]|uniref:uncharacterized protein n=1 Tax=Polychytrium aggregatum TaxID=110093 RepID=UPI0022FF0A1F|nr:uncharacterized protein BJ171DRAFT_203882 [Polychytrium aggregatum]KAI9199538.1 hypothetical protein BJ171DRAFT_203882 [Polychytrium aggregatum]